ncbi:hypothetical protein RchiOBHm_Chr7g0215011 [Rosa chinensis]|uniref:Uncharacterized protein n=1 Tax=Rosa chinensis TaxID=74649 RepID=A0A2P6PBD3_ROSCH|nr:hypothetical protein RchiOBHm_Chr7g0215011 [Rosa chinensis]
MGTCANSCIQLLSIAEETLAEFLSKATGTAVDWVQMPRMKPGQDSVGIYLCYFIKLQWSGSSSQWSRKFRAYDRKCKHLRIPLNLSLFFSFFLLGYIV